MTNTIKLKKTPKLKNNPIFKGLPDKLKEVSCYAEIEQKLRLVLVSDHTHPTLKGFAKCARCQAKVAKRRALIEEYGFKSFDQYLAWRKVMDVIYNKRDIKI